jgi:hypothetical protein
MVGAHHRTSCRRLLKRLEILTVSSQYIYIYIYIYIYPLMMMIFYLFIYLFKNQETFQTNLSVHNINTRSKHHFHRTVANLSCFQKGASYSGIKIFNSLPRSITSLKNEKTQFRIALKKFLYVHSFYSVDEFFARADDMYC